MSFTLRFFVALLLGVAAAVIISPFVAVALATAGFHFPFPRIFDRCAMVTLLAVLIYFARDFRLKSLLRTGFRHPAENLGRAVTGLAVAFAAIALLFIVAALLSAREAWTAASVAARASHYILAAIAIGIIEEGFFRAFLLGGMADELGPTSALVLSSAIYAFAHLVRSPAHYYLTGLHPAAGFADLGASLTTRLGHPAAALPTLFGLFLLGLLLGDAFLATGTVYFSIGLHAGLVVGAKTWPVIDGAEAALPHWLGGYGYVPLVSGAAGWAVTVALLILVRPILCRRAPS
jgi:CAAX protease family protein